MDQPPVSHPTVAPSALNVLVIGAGHSVVALLPHLADDPAIRVAAVVDMQRDAPGITRARQLGLPTGLDYHEYICDETLDLVINATGNTEFQQELRLEKLPQTVLIGKESAQMIWMTMEAERRPELLQELLRSGRASGSAVGAGFIAGDTEQMREILTMVTQVAVTPTTVLIRGESGTGKEMVARMIHSHSPMRGKPLITVNCTAFSASLIESELFGYKKGAFTGAVTDRTGLLELAHNGTIFLDEVGDMPIEMQAKLLRFLQSGEIRPVGDFKTRRVKVRIIAATNRNLEEAIESNQFRSDLFYRLNAFTIHTPPLRDRMEDIPILVSHFLKLANAKVKKSVEVISPEVWRIFHEYRWPGNVRELKNVIERAAVLATGECIEAAHLPLGLREAQPVNGAVPAAAVDEALLGEGLMALKTRMVNRVEYEALCRYLTAHGGNVSKAAEAAQVPRRTFQRLLAKHGISARAFKPASVDSIPSS